MMEIDEFALGEWLDPMAIYPIALLEPVANAQAVGWGTVLVDGRCGCGCHGDRPFKAVHCRPCSCARSTAVFAQS